MKKSYSTAVLAWICVASAFPQIPARVDSYTPKQLAHLAQPLHAQANASNGTASRILAHYPRHSTMLVYRDKDGEVELHQHFADVMFILSGKATLVTGGVMQGARTIKEGEMRGKSIVGGFSVLLTQGTIAHIPANTPHQLLIPRSEAITYIVVKVRTDPS